MHKLKEIFSIIKDTDSKIDEVCDFESAGFGMISKITFKVVLGTLFLTLFILVFPFIGLLKLTRFLDNRISPKEQEAA